MLLKPVVIPVEILALQKAKLPEKLLLAIFVADPKAKALRRKLSMTRAGVRKLEQRLVDKGLLTVDGDRHLIHVPGLVYSQQSGNGHFVSDSTTKQNKEKVATQRAKTTAVYPVPLVVPAELLSNKYLMASAKLVLAYYAANPKAPNEYVLATLGLSSSGLKKLKRGLLEKRVLIQINDAYSVRLPGLMLVRDSEGSHFVSESEAEQNGNKVTMPAPKLVPAGDLYQEWAKQMVYLRSLPDSQFGGLQEHTARMRKRVEHESPESRERAGVLAEMQANEDRYFALQYVYDNIPRKHEAAYTKLAAKGTPEQLAAFRERAEGMTLAGMPEPKQLGFVLEAIAHLVQPEPHKSSRRVAARRERSAAVG